MKHAPRNARIHATAPVAIAVSRSHRWPLSTGLEPRAGLRGEPLMIGAIAVIMLLVILGLAGCSRPAGQTAGAGSTTPTASGTAGETIEVIETGEQAPVATATVPPQPAVATIKLVQQQPDGEPVVTTIDLVPTVLPPSPATPATEPAAAASEPAAPASEPAAPVSEPAAAAPEPAVGPAPAAAAAAGPREQVMLGDPTLTAGVPPATGGPITLAEIETWLADPRNHAVLEPLLPLGLSQGAAQIVGLDENPLTRAKIELGRQLYFDPRLSADATVSCASCHHPDTGYTARTKTGVGIREQAGGRNSPVSYNRILSGPQFWDGRVDSLEAQAVGPIANPIEMGFTHEGVVERLAGIPVYRRQFETIFGDLTIDRVGQAIAAFERALVTAPSPYDYGEQLRAFAGLDPEDIADDEELAAKFAAATAAAEAHPMSESARRGREIFFTEKGNCSACHVGANLADEKYHNLGIGMDKDTPDLGRFVVTNDPQDTGAFKTPTIRNVALTAPYMHDGSVATLEEVVEIYDKGGHPNPHLSDKIRPLKLTAEEKADLVEFMKSCTGPTPSVETSRLPADG